MAHWSLVTYTRPNTDTAWFEPSAEVLALIDTYKNDDLVNPTIETYEKIESSDKLKQYSLCLVVVSLLSGCGLIPIDDGSGAKTCDGTTVSYSNTTRAGALTTSETWSGTMTVSGDILLTGKWIEFG